MRINLYYKIIGVIFLTILLSLTATAVIVGYYGKKNFLRYLYNSKIQEFEEMADNLGSFYERYGSLDKVISREIPLTLSLLAHDSVLQRQPERMHPPRRKPPFPGEKEIFALFDTDMNYLVGAKKDPDHMHIFPVNAEGVTVANLGIIKLDKSILSPFAAKFIDSQRYLLFLALVTSLGMAAVIAYTFTRSILRPVNRLKEAAKKIAERDFDVELSIKTKDEIEELADNFKTMADTLKEYEQKQSRWISDISHELRTPLSVILGNIEAVLDGVRKPDSETMGAVYKNTMRMKRLVNELNDITMAESGSMTMKMIRADIASELKNMIDFYSIRLAENSIRVITDVPDEPVTVLADIMRLNQVFINILENTVKYAEAPGGFYISLEKTCSKAVLSFEDTGPGVSDEHLSHLFDRLYRVDSSRSSQTGGSGLGLSICKYITEAHGGSVKAEKSSKGGLKLEISLPLEEKDE